MVREVWRLRKACFLPLEYITRNSMAFGQKMHIFFIQVINKNTQKKRLVWLVNLVTAFDRPETRFNSPLLVLYAPSSLPPSLPSRHSPTNTKEPNKNKILTFWRRFRDSPHESDFILVTQVRAIICCLLILFKTQSESGTFPPPRLLRCGFPLHR